MNIQQESINKATSIDDMVKYADSLNKLEQHKRPQVPSNIADKYNYKNVDTRPRSESIESQSTYEKGRFIEQPRKEYIQERKEETSINILITISIIILLSLIVIIAISFKNNIIKLFKGK